MANNPKKSLRKHQKPPNPYSPNKTVTIDNLSSKNLQNIFMFLGFTDLLQLMLVNKKFKNLIKKSEPLHSKLILTLRKSWLDCPIKCAVLDEMIEEKREFKRLRIIGNNDRFYSMDYEAFISKCVLSITLCDFIVNLSELKRLFHQFSAVQIVKFSGNKVYNLEEEDPYDDLDDFEDYDDSEDDQSCLYDSSDEYMEHYICAEPEIISLPFPHFRNLKQLFIISGNNWGGRQDQTELFKSATHVEKIVTDARDLNFLVNKQRLTKLHLKEKKELLLTKQTSSNFLTDEIQLKLRFRLKVFSWSVNRNSLTQMEIERLQLFLKRQYLLESMRLHVIDINNYLAQIDKMKNLTLLDIVMFKMELPATPFVNSTVIELKIAFGEITNWSIESALKFLKGFTEVDDLNVNIVLSNEMDMESSGTPITLESLKNLQNMQLSVKSFKHDVTTKNLMKNFMQLIAIQQLKVFKIGPLPSFSELDWRKFCRKNPGIQIFVIRSSKQQSYTEAERVLLKSSLNKLKSLQISGNVSACKGCPQVCICQQNFEKLNPFLEDHQY